MAFSRPSLAEILARIAGDINSRLAGADALLRRSNLNVLARTLAGAVNGLYGYLDWIARQILPDTADAEILDRWAAIWGVARKAAAAASGTLTFTGTNGVIIPTGTQLLRSDGATFATTADGVIAAGAAVIAVAATVPGQEGNTAAAVVLNLASPVAGVNNVATVTAGTLSGGADTEVDDALRARLLARIQQPPQAGALSDYVEWALEVPGVTRAWAFSRELGAGAVTVRFVRDNDAGTIIPDAGEVAAVQALIDSLRPVTAAVTVVAPISDALNFTLHIVPDTQAIRDAVTTELQDLLMREAAPGGTLPLSHIRESVGFSSGVTDYALTAPVADVVSATGHIPTFGAIAWV